ncbi:GerAB/ArcD/ProY family transporter [Paenibacillus jiagnxiensis]|uniref:GerAB/ArcD/ProY family transporter n=1 Tax=Paenibacillus jiagnxiensis TaxID=3228926 RepID=UPI0033A222E3
MKVNMPRISSGQMFALMVHFILGTSEFVSLGAEAERDAWLSDLIGMAGGLLLFLLYYYPSFLFPRMTLIEYSRQLLGKGLGSATGFLYSMYFLYVAAVNLRDGVELVNINMLTATPKTVIALLMTLCMMYVTSLGAEVLARTALIFWFAITVVILTMNSLLLISGSLEFDRLLPILSNGWQPVLDSVLRETLMFPYGEMICIMMLMPFLKTPEKGLPVGIAAILTGGVLLIQAMALNIASLGPEIATRSVFPLVIMMGKIQLSELFTRMDIFALTPMIIVAFIKVTILFYAALLGLSDIFRIEFRKLVLPMGCILLVWSVLLAPSLMQHLEFGAKLILFIHPLFVVAIPLLLASSAFFHRRRGGVRGFHKTDPQSE